MTALAWLLACLAVMITAIGTLLKLVDWLARGSDAPVGADWEPVRRCSNALRRRCVRDCLPRSVVAAIAARPWVHALVAGAGSIGLMLTLGLVGQWLLPGPMALDGPLGIALSVSLLFAFLLCVLSWRAILQLLLLCAERGAAHAMLASLLLMLAAASLLLPELLVATEIALRYPLAGFPVDAASAMLQALSGLAEPARYLHAALTHWLPSVLLLLTLSLPIAGVLLWSLIRLAASGRVQALVEAALRRLVSGKQSSRAWAAWALIGLGGLLAGLSGQVGL